MRRIAGIVLAVLFQLLNSLQCHHVSNRITVYYESICPDSRRFMLNQLIPAYDKLNNLLEIDLIPFGNANVSYPNHDFKPYFQCQHGPDECYGNKAHACVIDMNKNTKLSLNYIKCMFESDNWKQTMVTAQQCAKKLSLIWEKEKENSLQECVDGSNGERLLVAHSHKTFNLNPHHKSVPWVVIDGKHTDDMQRLAEKNLLKYLCDTYHSRHEPKLAQCSEDSTQAKQSSSLELQNSFLIFFTTLIISIIYN